MRRHPRTRYLLCAVLPFAAPGCESLHRYRPVPVLVRDAETKRPIPGAEVHIRYPLTRSSTAPCLSSETTGSDGIARLRAAPAEGGLTVDAAANGYLPQTLGLTAEAVGKIEPAHLFEDAGQRPAGLVVEMLAGPHPTIELVVPNGYRGVVKAEVHIQEDALCPPGQRRFTYPVDPPETLQIVGPPLLRRVYPPDFRAKYADGTVLSQQAADTEVGLRPLRSEGDVQVFVIGTKDDLDRWLPVREPGQDDSRPRQDHGGGGRHGRGGSQPASP
jgi:hypothetical protein